MEGELLEYWLPFYAYKLDMIERGIKLPLHKNPTHLSRY